MDRLRPGILLLLVTRGVPCGDTKWASSGTAWLKFAFWPGLWQDRPTNEPIGTEPGRTLEFQSQKKLFHPGTFVEINANFCGNWEMSERTIQWIIHERIIQ